MIHDITTTNDSASNTGGAIIANTPDQIRAFQLLAIKGALKLETLGLRHSSGRSAASTVRAILTQAKKPAPRDRAKLLAAYCDHLRAIGVLVTPAPVLP